MKGKVEFSSAPFLNFEMLQPNYVNRMPPFNGSIHTQTGSNFTFYRQIEHKDCDQVKERCLMLMNVYSPMLVTPAQVLANPSLPSAERLTDFNLEKRGNFVYFGKM